MANIPHDDDAGFVWERVRPGQYHTKGEYKGVPYEYVILKHEYPTRWVSHDRLRQDEHGFGEIRYRADTLKKCKRMTFAENHRVVKRELEE